MEEFLKLLYARKDARVAKFRLSTEHDSQLRAAFFAEWDAIESVNCALRELEKAEKITDSVYANP